MNRTANLINNIITIVVSVGLLMLSVSFGDNTISVYAIIGYGILGVFIFGFINTLLHETAHVIAGKRNGFSFISMNVWFFKWSKINGKIRFDFVMIGEEAGYTEMIPDTVTDFDKGYRKMTFGGSIPSIFLTLIGIVPLIFSKSLPAPLFYILGMLLPVSVYFLLNGLLPMESGGVKNDGAVLYGLKKGDPSVMTSLNLLRIHGELYNGKTPSEIDEKLYFDLPQLPEDDLNFLLIYNARYNYYVDKGLYKDAKKVSDRIMQTLSYYPKAYRFAVKADALYNACTFDYDEDLADDLTDELEKYLNSSAEITKIRIKLAYIFYVKKEYKEFDDFYEMAKRQADKFAVKGIARYEHKLIDKIKDDYDALNIEKSDN